MPTFTAISVDSLLDRSLASKSMVHNSKLEKKRRTINPDKKIPRQQKGVSPLLYATPETTPVPDSSSSFPPSPYIINHKRRGPCLISKSISQDHISAVNERSTQEQGNVDNNEKNPDSIGEFSFTSSAPVSIPCEEVVVGSNGFHDYRFGSTNFDGDGLRKMPNSIAIKSEKDYEFEDLFVPQRSMSFTSSSNTVMVDDCIEPELSSMLTTPVGEYFDAFEELSSEGGPPSSLQDVEAELREIRQNLLTEVEKRKRAEESFNNMRTHWQQLQQRLSVIGLKLLAAPTNAAEDKDFSDPAEDLCQQIHIARIVSNSVGRGSAKAEAKMELKSLIESKNFEIARLWDRLHYYEVVNSEMSQRNQEAVEMERRLRQRRKRRQRWGIWSSIGASITIGTMALLWSSYNSTATASGSSTTNFSDAPSSGNDLPN